MRARVTSRITVVALLLSFVVGCAPTLSSKAIQAGAVAAQLADVHSTKAAIESGRGREGNPLLPDSWLGQGVVKAAAAAGVMWLGTTLELRGHRTLARVAQLAAAAATAAIAARNYAIAR